MRNTITVKEAAKRWGITERRVTVLCKEDRIEGAYKKSRCWVIPAEAEKPVDSRVKTGAYRSGLKNNRHLSYGFLTGILLVAKESIFSGLNNLKVNFILDNQYSEYFGFTPEEVKGLPAIIMRRRSMRKSAPGTTGIGLEIRKFLTHGLSLTTLVIEEDFR